MKPAAEHLSAEIDTTTPNIARVYGYLLGSKDNYAADRAVGDELLRLMPDAADIAKANRHFLGRAVHYLTGEAGVDQIIDLGAGLPTKDNTHEFAHRTNPAARVVYVDNDPVVLTHARALMDTAERTCVITADLRDPAAIIRHPDTHALIDFTRPVAVVFAAVLHFVPGDEAAQIIGEWRKAMAPGSYLVISHAEDREELAGAADLYRQRLSTGTPRSQQEIAGLFAGLDLITPGLVPLPLWRPETSLLPVGAEKMPMLAGIGRRP